MIKAKKGFRIDIINLNCKFYNRFWLTGDIGFAILVAVFAAATDDDDEDSLSLRRFRLSSLDPPSPVLLTVTGAIELTVNTLKTLKLFLFQTFLFNSKIFQIQASTRVKPR